MQKRMIVGKSEVKKNRERFEVGMFDSLKYHVNALILTSLL